MSRYFTFIRVQLCLAAALAIVSPGAYADDSNSTDAAAYLSSAGGFAAFKYGQGRRIFDVSRTRLSSGIVHYQYKLRVGPGEFDVVRLHRLIRERKPYRPVRTKGAVFMLHGAQQDFDNIFLTAGSDDPSPEKSAALYLASRRIDVWGMDFGWTRVPMETSDFSFMANWGVERDVDHALDAIAVARAIRWLTGQGFGRMNLLGFSYGGGVAYAAAGRETQVPRRRRHIRGIIPVEIAMKYADEYPDFRQNLCNNAAGIQMRLDAGTYQNEFGKAFAGIGAAALNAPDEPSVGVLPPPDEPPYIPQHTNFQAALFVGAAASDAAPSWHFVGGRVISGVTVGLRYTDPARWVRLLESLPPYMPERARFDIRASICDEEEVSIDDHLMEIRTPILYIGAAGAFGTLGEFTSTLTASRDVSQMLVRLRSEEERSIDFGHAEPFLARDAKSLVWEPLRKWLVDH